MKKHIELEKKKVEQIKRFKQLTGKQTLSKVINDALDYVKTKTDYNLFDFVAKPPVVYVRQYYLFYGEEITGQFNVDVNKQTITFLHKDKKYFFRWEDMKDNITGLSSIIIAYATNYEDFEKLMNIYSPTLC